MVFQPDDGLCVSLHLLGLTLLLLSQLQDLTLLAHPSLESLVAGVVVVKDKLGMELDFDYVASISILAEKNGSVSWFIKTRVLAVVGKP